MAIKRRAFLDANVLRGQLTTDILLTLAYREQFEPRWSQDVLDEVRRNRPPGLPEAAIDKRLATMNRAFPPAMTSGYKHLMPEMRADAKDKHVLAAAVHSNSVVLVTENVKDFDPPNSGKHAMHVEKVSAFLNRLLDDDPAEVLAAMNEVVSRTDRAPNSIRELIDKMAVQEDLKGFAHDLNEAVPADQRGTHPSLQASRSAKVALDGIAPPGEVAAKSALASESRKSAQAQDKGAEREL
ncbi:PIN domain-containing protein [Kribbella orskensis]|uniref:PIN domain-containing protein n=1 Tax=Kribbella orskensis TaxID=2512216 RepID=A0ABY2BIV0_9ACTN|nr:MULTISPECIES: PIN domain-containing protein [Kribbella]TCN37967.1 PIN domain-containing protein [Kribbella sp. VKM Ac-2500]TCO19453.1 PIN domain-containing protein [Kribbella orskensis]